MLVPAARAQTLAEELQAQRAAVRSAELVAEMGLATEAWGPVEIAPDAEPSASASLLFWWLPRSRTPRVAVDSFPPVRPAVEAAPEPEPVPLTEIAWDRVAPSEQGAFLDRFREALWTVEGMTFFTPLDTIPTPELRARLNTHFGAPTRTAVARGVRGFEGSSFVQFEYWFVVNDSIPFVALDIDGPYGRGLVLAGDFEHKPHLGPLKRDLTAVLLRPRPLMPYVDYYQIRERNQWVRTGYDGDEYYVVEIERPRWARRRSGTGQWYLFR
ncbi:MAG: hypothetical protein AAGI91_01750 [Bacteroidota bacterium]